MEESVIEKKEHKLIWILKKKKKIDATLTTRMLLL